MVVTSIEISQYKIPTWWWEFLNSFITKYDNNDIIDKKLLEDYNAKIIFNYELRYFTIEFDDIEHYTEFVLRWL